MNKVNYIIDLIAKGWMILCTFIITAYLILSAIFGGRFEMEIYFSRGFKALKDIWHHFFK